MNRSAIALLAVMAGAAGCKGTPVMTISPGNPGNPVVVVASDCSPSERYGAEEFVTFVEQICGVRLEIRDDGKPVRRPMVLIGDSPALKQVAPDLSLDGLGLEGFVIKTVRGNLVLAGGRRRGSMYAVYELLDTRLDCRWFTTEVSRIPKRERIVFYGMDERFIPSLEYREPFYTEAFDATWSARNRMNGAHSGLDEKHGGKIVYRGFVHTFNALVPPQKYFKEHPEYFSMIDGQRTDDHPQLCLTNPDVVRICTEEVKRWLRQTPEADIVSVSQNDWGNYCQCPKCAALAEKEGSQSGVMLHFVNQIADNIKGEFPHVAVDTLAYQYTRSAPRYVKPRPNVIVRLCSIECSFSKTLEKGEANRSFAEDIRNWDKVCNRLYVWDYTTNFRNYLAPFPNIRVLGPNIRFFARHGVKGIFEQGAYGPGGGGQSAELKSYIIARCLWKPETDWGEAMDEFLEGVYGPAAGAVRKYYDTILDGVEASGVEVGIFNAPGKYLRSDLLMAAGKHLDEAERIAAGDDALQRRLRKVRMWWSYGAFTLANYERHGDEIVFAPGADSGAMLEGLEAAIKEFGVGHIREGQSVNEWLAQARKVKHKLQIVILKNDRATLEVLPAIGGRAISLIRRSDGRNLLFSAGSGTEAYPAGGGYEEYPTHGWRKGGWNESYKVVDKGADHITVEAVLDNYGLKITRKYTLLDDACGMRVSSMWHNVSDGPKQCSPYVHAAFAMGEAADCEGRWLTADGTWKAHSLAVKEMDTDHFYPLKSRDDIQSGQWMFWNRATKWGVVNRFEPAKVEFVEYDWHPRQAHYDLHVLYRARTLQPGECLQYENTYTAADKLP